MRVVHVHRIGVVGGSERHLLALLPALRELGVEPVFLGLDYLPGRPQDFYELLGAAGIRSERLACPRDLAPALPLALARALRRLRPDLVHTHLVHADLYGGLGSLLARVPLVSTKHNDDPFRAGPFRFVERLLARRARAIVTITAALARFNVDRVGLPPGKLEVVRYGLDELPPPWGRNPPLALPEGARVLLAVARLVAQKGLDVAVDALPLVRERHDAVLVVLGEGPERERLAARAAALGCGDRVLLPGRAGDVADWLRRAEVLVHPARWEGFGLVLLEAMLASLPIVATRVSAIPELVDDGRTGLLVPSDDAPALAGAIARVLEDPALAGTLAAAAAERARTDFSAARMAAETLAVYERALAAG